jgi:hypothetical protein
VEQYTGYNVSFNYPHNWNVRTVTVNDGGNPLIIVTENTRLIKDFKA